MTRDKTDVPSSGLTHFPVSFFAVLLGAFGLTIVLIRGNAALGLTAFVGEVTLWVSVALLGLIAVTYAIKALRYPGQIAWEWAHPVRINFFPAMAISLMLLATALIASGRVELARPVWIAGAAAQLGLTSAVLSSWISHRKFLPGQLGPAWFIPAVGNVVAPVAGVQLGYVDVSWYFLLSRHPLLGDPAGACHEPPHLPRSDPGEAPANARHNDRPACHWFHCPH